LVNVGFNAHIHPGDPCLAKHLQAHGYRTGFVGKVHFGRPPGDLGVEDWPGDGDPHRPEVDAVMKANQRRFIEEMHRIGWDEAAAITWGNIDHTTQRAAWIHNQEWQTEAALGILDKFAAAGDQPFYLTLSTNVIHGPDHGPSILELDPRASYGGMLDYAPAVQPTRQSILDRLREQGLPATHRTVGMTWIDDAFGVLVERLKALGIYDNTLIVYSADHGVEGKWSCHSNGTQVPQIWKLPDQENAGHRSHVMVQNIDFMPTVLDWCGIPLPEGVQLDGLSIRPALEGDQQQLRDALYFEFGYQRGLRTDRWKYLTIRYRPEDLKKMKTGKSPALNVHGKPGVSRTQLTHPHYWDPDQLYDFWTDPDEHMNLLNWPQNQEAYAALRVRLQEFTDRLNPAYPAQADPFQQSAMYRALCTAVNATNLSDIAETHPFYVEGSY